MLYLRQIISGGQTGADMGGLEAARILRLRTGGMAPYGYKTEDGPKPFLRAYGLTEASSPDYPPRTKLNILNSDGTVIFTRLPMSAGSALTFRLARQYKKPYHVVSLPDLEHKRYYEFLLWLEAHKIVILNVSGNRESSYPSFPGMEVLVRDYLVESLSSLMNQEQDQN